MMADIIRYPNRLLLAQTWTKQTDVMYVITYVRVV